VSIIMLCGAAPVSYRGFRHTALYRALVQHQWQENWVLQETNTDFFIVR
jgi:hypothetical protein